ncbi:histidine kinase [Ruminococcaceae bacterium OttesenSCG-928-L11]|nr:histidine kinase [Ruminococcaceae bacterium OttesenSCG-928-L11]
MERSLQTQLLLIMLLVSMPLALLLMGINVYYFNDYNAKLAVSNRRNMEMSVDSIESELEAIDETLMALIAGNTDFLLLSGGAGHLQAHLSSQTLITQMKTLMPAYSAVGAFFIYSTPSRSERDIFSGEFAYPEKQEIQKFVRACVAEDSITYDMEWRWAEIGGEAYLFRFYGGRGTYLTAMIPLRRLVRESEPEIGGEPVTVFTTADWQPLTQQDYIRENGIELQGDAESYFLSGKPRHMVISRAIRHTDCRLALLVNDREYLRTLQPVQIFFLTASLVCALSIPAFLFWLHRSVLRPLRTIQATMGHIREGDMDAKMPQNVRVKEFGQVHETFNSMIAQIKGLKIEAYEKEIESRNAELRYLHLQIRPHFFLNCLKSIYALARQGQYSKQEQMILAFSRHISYIFGDPMDMVPISREFEHIRNYLEIQQISAVIPPQYSVYAETAVEAFPIPPLSVQTFVENVFRHGVTPDRGLDLEVRASLLRTEEGAYVDITVADNGDGFPESVLKLLNEGNAWAESNRHIGIQNVVRRMRLVYGEDVMFAFFNNEKGAVSEMLIPVPEGGLSTGKKASEIDG